MTWEQGLSLAGGAGWERIGQGLQSGVCVMSASFDFILAGLSFSGYTYSRARFREAAACFFGRERGVDDVLDGGVFNRCVLKIEYRLAIGN